MGTKGRILGTVGAAGIVAMTAFGGLAAHAVGCVNDGNTSVCGPQSGGSAPGAEGSGGQAIVTASHYGPNGLPVSDSGTAAGVQQWWSTWGGSSWQTTIVGLGLSPISDALHSYAGAELRQDSYQDDTTQQRYTRASAGVSSWDAPGTPSVSVDAHQWRWSPADCETYAQATFSVAGIYDDPNFRPDGCPVDVPQIPATPPIG